MGSVLLLLASWQGVDPANYIGGQPTPAVEGPVGAVDATFDVNSSGASTYTFPIKVPPGTAGMQPRISISYSSHAPDGPVGMGFGIGGLSTVERCAATVAQDGTTGMVRFDENDRFCLDGLRLVRIAGAGYGQAGAEYHTEGETWTRVISHGVCEEAVPLDGDVKRWMTGPCSFNVTLKNGSEAEYGGAGAEECSSLVGAERRSAVRFSWPLTGLTDLHGNSLTVQWTFGGHNRCVPSRIDYTMNAKAGLDARRSVVFEYGGRSDITNRYVSGVRQTLVARLHRIRTYVKTGRIPTDTLVKEYRFDYESQTHTFRSRLIEVTECDGDGQCLPPTHLGWSNGDWMEKFTIFDHNTSYFPYASERLYAGDFDGNGKTDFLAFDFSQTEFGDEVTALQYLAHDDVGPLAFSVEDSLTVRDSTDYGEVLHIGDVNGDGFSDAVRVTSVYTHGLSQDGYRIYLGGPDGLSPVEAMLGPEPSLKDEVHLGDFDGDGRTDIITFFNRKIPESAWPPHEPYVGWKLYLFKGSGFVHSEEGSGTFTQTAGSFSANWDDYVSIPSRQVKFYLGDYNGDGRVDFLATKQIDGATNEDQPTDEKLYTAWKLYLSNGEKFQLVQDGVWPHDSYKVLPGDFNGDGLTDLVLTGQRNGAVNDDVQTGYLLLFSTGETFVPHFVHPQTFFVHPAGNSAGENIAWGYTGTEIAWRDRLILSNFNDDGMADVLALSDTSYGPGYKYDGAKMLVSLINMFSQVEQKPHPPDEPILVADLVGDGRTAILGYAPTAVYVFSSPLDSKPDLLVSIVDGVKGGIDLVHLPMTYEPEYYAKGNAATYPVRDYISSRYLTRHVVKTDGKAEQYHYFYYYAGARTDVSGRGFLGFESIRVQNPDGTQLETTYRQDFPFAGSVKYQSLKSSNTPISFMSFEYEDQQKYSGVHHVLMTEERTRDYDITTGQAISQKGKDYQYDGFGNLRFVVDRADLTQPAHDITTETIYSNNESAWQLGYPLEVKTYVNPDLILRHKKYTYTDLRDVWFEGNWDDTHQKFIGTTQEYDDFGNPKTSTDPLGNITHFDYDLYQLLRQTTNPLGHVNAKAIDPRYGVEVRRTDPNGHTTFIDVDGFGRTVALRGMNPGGEVVTLKRFSTTSVGFGFVRQTFTRRNWSAASPIWDWTEELHDALGRLYATRKRGIGAFAIVNEQEPQGLDLVKRISRAHFENEPPLWTEHSYDVKKRPLEMKAPGNQVVRLVYDDALRKVTKYDPNNATTVMLFDPRGRLRQQTDAMGSDSYFGHDPLGQPTTIITTEGLLTTTTYDTLGRRKSVEDKHTGTTSFGYDDTGHFVSETDAKGQQVVRTYDALDRTKTRTLYPAGSSTPAKVVEYEYDDTALAYSVGELSHVRTLVGGQTASSYDFAYDRYGHQSSARLQVDGRTFIWAQRFDPSGKATELTYPDGAVLRSTFNSAGMLEELGLHEVTDAPGSFTAHARYGLYGAEGRPGQLTHGNGLFTCYDYEAGTGLLHTTKTLQPTTPGPTDCRRPDRTQVRLLDYEYVWTKVNTVRSLLDKLDPARSQTFAYNGRGALEGAKGIYGTRKYAYSGNGTILQANGVTFTLDGQRVMSSTDGLVMAYDANGNTLSKQHHGSSWIFTWDTEDQLVTATRDGVATQFAYDFVGKRIKKTSSNGTITYYVSSAYEVVVPPGATPASELHTKYIPGPNGNVSQVTKTGVQLVAAWPPTSQSQAGQHDVGVGRRAVAASSHRLRPLAHTPDASGWLAERAPWVLLAFALSIMLVLRRVQPVGSVRPAIRRTAPVVVPLLVFSLVAATPARAAFVPGPDGPGIPVNGTFFFHQNHLGSTTLLTDSTGNVVSRIEYDPYGNIDSASSSGQDIFRAKFNGRELEADVGIQFFNARYYDPTLGRFLSPDLTLGGDIFKLVSLNRYAFAGNSPMTYADPTGRSGEVVFLVALGIAIVVGGLIGGTGGKIISDPAHAFDNWSWSRAIIGAWVGMVVAIIAFYLGTLGAASSTTLFGTQLGDVALKTFAGGVVSATTEYAAGERDGGRLLAYFGIGLLVGFASGTQLAGVGRYGTVAKISTETSTSMLSSSLKKAVNADKTFGISVWAFTVGFTKDGDIDFKPNYMFLAGTTISRLTQAAGYNTTLPGVSDRLLGQIKNGDWDEDTSGYTLDWLGRKLSTSYGPPSGGSVYGIMQSVAKGIVTYAVGTYLTATGSHQNAFDMINFGIDKTVPEALGVLPEELRKGYDLSTVKQKETFGVE
jgi:RHS repeat-associated protein